MLISTVILKHITSYTQRVHTKVESQPWLYSFMCDWHARQLMHLSALAECKCWLLGQQLWEHTMPSELHSRTYFIDGNTLMIPFYSQQSTADIFLFFYVKISTLKYKIKIYSALGMIKGKTILLRWNMIIGLWKECWNRFSWFMELRTGCSK